MKYSRFEWLVLALGTAVIIGGMLIGSGASIEPAEVVAQLLIVVVLASALHWGRNGGFSAAMLATLLYVYMRLPLLTARGFTDDLVFMIAARIVTYGVVGVVGGEICGRLKYLLARLESSPLVDETTGVYNRRYAAGAIRAGVAQWQRYTVPYSAITLTMPPSLLQDLPPARQRALLRQVASHIRNDIRMVDDLAHAGNGHFLVLLPQTPGAGASVACDRLYRGVSALLSMKESAVTATVFACDRNATALRNLADELDPEDVPVIPVPAATSQSVPVDA